MARGIDEEPARSAETHVRAVTYPTTRDELVAAAEDAEAPAALINFFKCLPRDRYDDAEAVERDFAEAGRRLAAGAGRVGDAADRRNIGRDAVEGPAAKVHHP